LGFGGLLSLRVRRRPLGRGAGRAVAGLLLVLPGGRGSLGLGGPARLVCGAGGQLRAGGVEECSMLLRGQIAGGALVLVGLPGRDRGAALPTEAAVRAAGLVGAQ